jgi:hypothetical protein
MGSQVRSVRRLQPLHQLARVHAESCGNLEQVVQAEIAPSALNLAQERPVDVAAFGECFLAEAQSIALIADALAQETGGWG